jgi:hypothetical protein
MTLRDYELEVSASLQDILYDLARLDTPVVTEFIIELAEHALEWEGYRELRDHFSNRVEGIDA